MPSWWQHGPSAEIFSRMRAWLAHQFGQMMHAHLLEGMTL